MAARRDGVIRDDWIVDESRNIIEVYDAYFDLGQESGSKRTLWLASLVRY